ncbi:MAG: hypothetical protein N3E47_00755 [Candidatus Bathyarchaeota archaeon]|nr:hypothetical protein [Candidatus Bathyarchaeota archaeon]
MIIGLDVGASLTKGILIDDELRLLNKNITPTIEPKKASVKVLKSLLKKIGSDYKGKVKFIAVSGGGSRFIGDRVMGLSVRRVNEIKSIGLGGLMLSDKEECLVVSAGTGTAMVAVYENGKIVRHACGTGVGGGTIIGLSRRILGISDFKILEEMALKGNSNNVDLTVGEIVGGPIGIVPANATASNLGKLTCESRAEDIAAGIFNMVSQTIGVLAAVTAKALNLESSVILVGMLPKSRVISRIICETTSLFGAKAIVPGDCEFANAFGAAVIAKQEVI